MSQEHLCYGADAVARYPIPSLGPARQGGPDARTVFALEQGTPSSAIYVSKTGGVHEGRTRRHDPPDHQAEWPRTIRGACTASVPDRGFPSIAGFAREHGLEPPDLT